MNVIVLVCKWCGDAIEPLRSEPVEYTHVKDGYSPCWAYTAAAVNAEPVVSGLEGGAA